MPESATLRDWPCTNPDHLGLCGDNHVHKDHLPPKNAARSSHVSRDIYDQLRESRDWWKSEWEHKNREADMWFGWCIALAFLCGVCFFMGTVIA